MRTIASITILLALALAVEAHAFGTRVSGPNFDGLVLDTPSPRPGVEVWVPAYDQIAAMEKALPAYVKQYIKAHAIVLTKPISKYKRHYLGIKDNGKRLIGVSYYSETLDFVASGKWLTEVGDGGPGGDDYMGAVYDLAERKFVLFEIYPKRGR